MASHDSQQEGAKILVHKDEVRKVCPAPMFKDKVPNLMSGEKPRTVSLIYFMNGTVQAVTETVNEIKELVNNAE